MAVTTAIRKVLLRNKVLKPMTNECHNKEFKNIDLTTKPTIFTNVAVCNMGLLAYISRASCQVASSIMRYFGLQKRVGVMFVVSER